MKRRLLTALTASLAVAPAWLPRAARAADAKPPVHKDTTKTMDDGDQSSEDSSGDSGGEEAATPGEGKGQSASQSRDLGTFKNGVPKPPGDKVAMPVVNETHTVIKGDTLWDLSQHYLGNPWYWPKVWSYNPQIANPHWIYPGDNVKFSGTGGPSTDEEAPAEVQPVGEGDEDDDDDSGAVSTSGKIGYVAPSVSSFRQDGLITDRELEESGQIVRSPAEKQLMDNLDKVYCRFKSQGDAKSGDRFFVFRTVREVKHPITGAHFGFLTHIVGTVTVQGSENGMTTGIIDHTWGEIERGDYLAPYSDKLSKQVPEKVATRKVDGVILDSLSELGLLSESMVIFVDKGKKDGLEEGNILEVTRQADGLQSYNLAPSDQGYEDTKLPIATIGRLMVIDAKESAATCLVLRSIREFAPGDRFNTVTTTANSVSLR